MHDPLEGQMVFMGDKTGNHHKTCSDEARWIVVITSLRAAFVCSHLVLFHADMGGGTPGEKMREDEP